MPATRRTSFKKEKEEKTEGFKVEKFTLCFYSLYVFVSLCVRFVLAYVFTLTDLQPSEDAVCVYVVLGTDKHGWRRGCGFTVIAGCMATAGQEKIKIQSKHRRLQNCKANILIA